MNNPIWSINELDKVKQNNYKVFSCFAGGGGSSMGYKLAGYDVIGINEVDKRMLKAYLANMKPKYVFDMPIQEFNKLDKYPDELYGIDLLDASFPCQLFSTANIKADKLKGKEIFTNEGRVKQVVDELAFETIKLVSKLQPKVVVMENVKGLLQNKNKWYVDEIIKMLNEIGYYTKYWLLNAMYMGVPQKRERVFFISVKKEHKDLLDTINMNFNNPIIPIKRFIHIDKLKDVPNYLKPYVDYIQEGDTNFSKASKRVDGVIKYFSKKILSENNVCYTVRAGENVMFIKEYKKILNFKHLQVVQSFPIDYNFNGSNKAHIVGMSVPPKMMMNVSDRIKKYILDKIRKG